MYFAKLNFNSEIYKVYEDGSILTEFLNKVFLNLTDKVAHIDDKGKKTKFITLLKDENGTWISGRIVLIAPGTNVSYDEVKDDIVETHDKNGANYVTFYFDLSREIIAFIPKRSFGHVMFVNAFKTLLELCVKDVAVEIFLEKNIHILKEKIYNLDSVQIVEIDIVPPNGDKEDFEALFGTKAEEIKETKATKFAITLAAPAKISIDVKSKYIDRLIMAVSKGFGKMVVRGKDKVGTKATVTSDKDAPFNRPVPDLDKDDLIEFPVYAKSGITELMAHKLAVDLEQKLQG
ncbi:MAG TPA: hypothetical protein VFC84_19135 [Desulfosporosinus sp.]|nr:hypothetical protein [Desulfosporosinus sp.]